MNVYSVLLRLLLVNTAISLGYLLVMYRNKDKRAKGLAGALFMFFCPAAGPLFLFCTWLFYFLWIRLGKREVNPQELSFNKDRVNLKVGTDVEKDANRIPLEEALLVASVRNKREVFLNVLKDDYEESMETIKEAVNDDDTEISHYVAASIMDAAAKFKEQETSLYAGYKEDPTMESWIKYAGFVIAFLKKDILSAPEKEKQVGRLQDEMEQFSKENWENMGSAMIADMADLWRQLGNYWYAEYWLEIGFGLEEDSLLIYKAGLSNYFSMGSPEKFLGLLQKLKESSVIFDDEVLEWVRFFG